MPALTPLAAKEPSLKPQRQQPSSSSRTPWFVALARTVVWSALSAALILILLETVFALAHIGEEEFVEVTPTVGFSHTPNRAVTWRSEGFSTSTTNTAGFRDREWRLAKPAGTTRIAVVGDSMTEAYQVPIEQTFVRRTEDLLKQKGINAETMNFGMSGFSTVQALYLFNENIKQYKPDVCVLAYHVGDNEKNLYTPGAEGQLPRPYAMISPQGKLLSDWTLYDSWHSSPAATHYAKTADLRHHSRIWAVLTKLDLQLMSNKLYKKTKKALAKVLPSQDAPPIAAPGLRTTEMSQDLLGHSYTPSKFVIPELPPYKSFPPPTEFGDKMAKEIMMSRTQSASVTGLIQGTRTRFDVTAQLIQLLNQCCRENNCKLVVMALPAPSNSMLYWRELRWMKALAQQDGFTFTDTNTVFPKVAPMEKSDVYYNIHFTKKGHDIVANVLTDALIESHKVPATQNTAVAPVAANTSD
jgi:hypothetical protein